MYENDILVKITRIISTIALTIFMFVTALRIPSIADNITNMTEQYEENQENTLETNIINDESESTDTNDYHTDMEDDGLYIIELDENQTIDAHTAKHILTYIGTGFLIVTGISALSFIAYKGGVLIAEEKRKKKRRLQNEQRRKALEELSKPKPYDIFRNTLEEHIEKLITFKRKINDEKMDKFLKNIKEIWIYIKNNTDETECDKGNIGRMNSIYIPSFLNLVEQLINLKKMKQTPEVKETVKKLETAIYEHQQIFENILHEATEKELINAQVDASVSLRHAEMNGLYETCNSLSGVAMQQKN